MTQMQQLRDALGGHGNLRPLQKDLFRILSVTNTRRKFQLFILLVLQILGGFTEVISLAAVLPFLSALSNASEFIALPELQEVIRFFGIRTTQELILFTSFGFAIVFFGANIMKAFIFWFQIRLGVMIGTELNAKFCHQLLNQEYEYHLNTNSSTSMSRSVNDLADALKFITSSMMIVTQGVSIIFIFAAVMVISAGSAQIIFATTVLVYLFIVRFNRAQIVNNGKVISDARAAMLKTLQVGLGGIRDVLLVGKQKHFVHHYARADRTLRNAAAYTQFLKFLPRIVIEIVAVTCLVVATAILALSSGGIFSAIPVLATLAMATTRILPAAQMVYSSYATMQSSHFAVVRCLSILLRSPAEEYYSKQAKVIPFERSVSLEDVWFRFNSTSDENAPSPWILKGATLSIPAKKIVALVGRTGSGKTTMSDVIAGLLHPEKGTLRVDDTPIDLGNVRTWRQNVACVPQSIFLLDASFKENVAFGEKIKDIDLDRVRNVCSAAQINDLILDRPNQYEEIIGENGLKLSGGQRQRIGLARALYRDTPLLILDEATSALDNKTEKTLMDAVLELKGDRTILIIAHRLETIRKADIVYETQNGKIVAKGNFKELLQYSESFREIALTHDRAS